MRRISFVFFFFVGLFSFGRNDSTLFFNEFSFSVNSTGLRNNLNGYGFGFYHIFKATPKLELRYGLEYNFSKVAYEGNDGQTQSSNHVTSLNYFTLPLLLRENMGRKWKFFFEQGVFVDAFIDGRDVADFHSYGTNYFASQDTSWHISEHIEARRVNWGILLGTGLTFPLRRMEITCKFDAKLSVLSIGEQIFANNSFIRFSVALRLPKFPWKKNSK